MPKKMYHVGPAKMVEYKKILIEPSRTPSRGGNTGSVHQHSFLVDGERYRFLAVGLNQWVFKNDTVEFDWFWNDSGEYRYIDRDTIRTVDDKGQPVIRGDRSWKKLWKSVEQRPPASGRERRG